jgi:hypothetical protein
LLTKRPFFSVARALSPLLLVALAAASAACGSSTGADSGRANVDGGSADDAAVPNPCPAQDSHVVDDAGTCASSIAWTAGPSIATPRNHHMTWLVDQGAGAAFLYVAGGSGNGSKALADVQRAPIADDGTLGAWEAQTPLPNGIIAASVIVTHGEVILTAGYETTKTWISKIGSDGSMGAWTAGPDQTGSYFHATGLSYGDFAYVIGGLDDTGNLDQISRASIAKDGTLGAWTKIGKLPYVLSHHAAAVNGKTIYVLGGETMDGVPRADVLRSTVADDGSLSTWITDTAMPIADETHAAFIHDGDLYFAGGIGGPTDLSLATIARAQLPVDANGSLGAWVTDATSALPHARSHVHQMPIRGKYIYSVAGAPTGFPSVTGASVVGTFQ